MLVYQRVWHVNPTRNIVMLRTIFCIETLISELGGLEYEFQSLSRSHKMSLTWRYGNMIKFCGKDMKRL
jgi:hypothetical protein